MNLLRTFDAESETLSLTDVKDQLNITNTDSDDNLRAFISAVRHYTENYLQKTLVTSVWELKLDCFPAVIALTMRPIASITSVVYIDTDGDSQTLSSALYQFDAAGRLMPAYAQTWPSTRLQFDAVTITYVAGKTHAGNVEPDIKQAMKLLVGGYDVNRENVAFSPVTVIPNSARDLLAPHRVLTL